MIDGKLQSIIVGVESRFCFGIICVLRARFGFLTAVEFVVWLFDGVVAVEFDSFRTGVEAGVTGVDCADGVVIVAANGIAPF